MQQFLSKIRVTNRHIQNSVRISDKYYSLGALYDDEDRAALIAELKKIQIVKKEGFLITKNVLLSQFDGDDSAAMRFMYIFEALIFKSTTFNTGIKRVIGGQYAVEVIGDLGAIINALEGTSGSHETEKMEIEYPDISSTKIVKAEILFGSYNVVELTFSEPVFGDPELTDFEFSQNKNADEMEIESITITNNLITIVIEDSYTTGEKITMSYIKNDDPGVRLRNSNGGEIDELIDLSIVNTIGGR